MSTEHLPNGIFAGEAIFKDANEVKEEDEWRKRRAEVPRKQGVVLSIIRQACFTRCLVHWTIIESDFDLR